MSYNTRKGKSVSQLIRMRLSRPSAIRRRIDVSKAPSLYKADPFQNRKFRFSNSSGSPASYSITRGQLLNLYTWQNSGGTVLYSLLQSIRVKRVQIWGIPASNSTKFLAISVIWKSINAPDVEISKSGTQMTPSYITTHPPAESLAGFWTSFDTTSASEILFQLNLQGGEMIDVEVEYVPASGQSPFNNSVSSRSQTGVSYNSLDGNSAVLQPVSNVQLT